MPLMIHILLAISISLTLLSGCVGLGFRSASGISTIEYLGREFRLSKTYFDYDDYKNDPNNLLSNEIEAIQSLMLSHRIDRTFPTDRDFGLAAGQVKFPGYGMAGLRVEATEGQFLLVSIEVPHGKCYRYFLAKQTPDGVHLVHDFVHPEPQITRAIVERGTIVYYAIDTPVRQMRH